MATAKDQDTHSGLRDLTATYDEGQHGAYVDHLRAAVAKPHIRNIALTGGYGAGKSSILTEFVRRERSGADAKGRGKKGKERVVELGLATVGIDEAPPDPKDPASSKTNRIERELVKQLLYSSNPLHGSRFQRIKPLSWTTAALRVCLVVLAVGGILRLFDLVPPRFPGLPDDASWVWHVAAAISLLAVATFAGAWVQRLVSGKVSIQNVSVGSATVSLGENSASYFDKYLDEIIHFFTHSKIRIVVLEDVDRFNDPHIFEELRELNTLINRSRMLVDDPVRFVYALKDSIFAQLGRGDHVAPSAAPEDRSAEAEALLGSRTKFFDIVIPVVPFITPRSARDLLRSELRMTNAPTPGDRLISLVARRVPDMRLLKNICNEYEVFAARLLRPQVDGKESPLGVDSLFAMVVYKNVQLEQFEKIARGTSVLDQIYTTSRDAVRKNIAHNEQLTRTLRQRLDRLVSPAAAKRMGRRLSWFIAELLARNPGSGAAAAGLQVAGKDFAMDTVDSLEFWTAIAGSPEIAVSVTRRNQLQQPLTITSEQLTGLLDNDGDPADWGPKNRATVESEIDAVAKQTARIRTSDFADLAASRILLDPQNKDAGSFDACLEKHLGHGLAMELVGSGYLDQNFTLYAGQFYGEYLTTNVTTFIVRHAQPGVPDFDYPLTGNEADALLNELGARFLGEPASFNRSLLDHLFDSGDERASKLLAPIVRRPDKVGLEFLTTYLQESEKRSELAKRLAGAWPETFNLLLTGLQLTDVDRASVVDAALAYVSDSLAYTSVPELREYLRDHAGELTSLTTPLRDGQAPVLATVLAGADVLFDDITLLDETLRAEVVTRDAYTLNPANLSCAIGSQGEFPLDLIRGRNQAVYDRCVANPSEYLAAVAASPASALTVRSPDTFEDVLADAVTWETAQIRQLVANADAKCRVERLSDVPTQAWPSLAAEQRFPTTLANVRAYLEITGGQIDEVLAVPLTNSGAIIPIDGDVEDTKRPVATAVIRAAQHLTAEDRVSLAGSLDLAEYIPAGEISPEPGPLLALLLKHELVEDAAEIFARFRDQGWETFREGIIQSKKFSEFASPEVMPEPMVAHFFRSEKLDATLRLGVLARIEDFAPAGTPEALASAARFALASKTVMPLAFVQRLADATKDPVVVLPLLNLLDSATTLDEVKDVLMRLGAPYTGFAGAQGTKLLIPDDRAHRQLVDRLRKAGLTGSPRPTKLRHPGKMSVTVA